MQKSPPLRSMRKPCVKPAHQDATDITCGCCDITCGCCSRSKRDWWSRSSSRRSSSNNNSCSNNETQRCRRRKAMAMSSLTFSITLAFAVVPRLAIAMRIPRPWSEGSACERAVDPDWPFVYSKYSGQEVLYTWYMIHLSIMRCAACVKYACTTWMNA